MNNKSISKALLIISAIIFSFYLSTTAQASWSSGGGIRYSFAGVVTGHPTSALDAYIYGPVEWAEDPGRSIPPDLVRLYAISELRAIHPLPGSSVINITTDSYIVVNSNREMFLWNSEYGYFSLQSHYDLFAESYSRTRKPIEFNRIDNIETPTHEGVIFESLVPNYQLFYENPILQSLSTTRVHLVVLLNPAEPEIEELLGYPLYISKITHTFLALERN